MFRMANALGAFGSYTVTEPSVNDNAVNVLARNISFTMQSSRKYASITGKIHHAHMLFPCCICDCMHVLRNRYSFDIKHWALWLIIAALDMILA